jgi:hypothetical protein
MHFGDLKTMNKKTAFTVAAKRYQNMALRRDFKDINVLDVVRYSRVGFEMMPILFGSYTQKGSKLMPN